MGLSLEAEYLRKLLAANIKTRRDTLKISQEKLAELIGVSAQMINCIEGCRTWVSDKTLVKLACALQVEAFQLLVPGSGAHAREADPLLAGLLGNLRQNIMDDIETRFEGFMREKEAGE